MPKINILNSIKSRRTIRCYKKTSISNKLLQKVLEGGRWAQSVHNQQPWKFIIVKNRDIISQIATIVSKFASRAFVGFNIVLKETAKNIEESPALLIIYNTGNFSKRIKHLDKPYLTLVELFEIQSIAAAMQNMCLVAHDLGLGTAWLGGPLFCEKEINKLLNEPIYKLMGIISIGKPLNYRLKIPKRKKLNEITKIIP